MLHSSIRPRAVVGGIGFDYGKELAKLFAQNEVGSRTASVSPARNYAFAAGVRPRTGFVFNRHLQSAQLRSKRYSQ
jgi:hypothetical protein